MATTNADADYVDRMLRLHPWRDASVIIAERASYLAMRTSGDRATPSAKEAPSVTQSCGSPELGILRDRWYEQKHGVHVPLRTRGSKEEIH
jgi:hypothetical protein